MSSGLSLNGKEIFESDWLGSIDLGGKDLTVKIVLIEKAEVFNPKTNAKSMKLAFRFEGQQKGFICNRTNATSISNIPGYGTEAEKWTGKLITLYPTTCKVGRETKTCLRVREKLPAGSKPANQKQADKPAEQPPQDNATRFKAMKDEWKIAQKAIGGHLTEAAFREFADTTTGGMVPAAKALETANYTAEHLAACEAAVKAMMPQQGENF